MRVAPAFLTSRDRERLLVVREPARHDGLLLDRLDRLLELRDVREQERRAVRLARKAGDPGKLILDDRPGLSHRGARIRHHRDHFRAADRVDVNDHERRDVLGSLGLATGVHRTHVDAAVVRHDDRAIDQRQMVARVPAIGSVRGTKLRAEHTPLVALGHVSCHLAMADVDQRAGERPAVRRCVALRRVLDCHHHLMVVGAHLSITRSAKRDAVRVEELCDRVVCDDRLSRLEASLDALLNQLRLLRLHGLQRELALLQVEV
eukprot:7391978-Prymnesium_polylepis.2